MLIGQCLATKATTNNRKMACVHVMCNTHDSFKMVVYNHLSVV